MSINLIESQHQYNNNLLHIYIGDNIENNASTTKSNVTCVEVQQTQEKGDWWAVTPVTGAADPNATPTGFCQHTHLNNSHRDAASGCLNLLYSVREHSSHGVEKTPLTMDMLWCTARRRHQGQIYIKKFTNSVKLRVLQRFICNYCDTGKPLSCKRRSEAKINIVPD